MVVFESVFKSHNFYFWQTSKHIKVLCHDMYRPRKESIAHIYNVCITNIEQNSTELQSMSYLLFGRFFSLAASLLVNADSILKVLQSRQIEWSSVCRSGYSVQTHYKYLYSSSHWIDVCACVFVEYVRLWCVQNGIESQRYIEKKLSTICSYFNRHVLNRTKSIIQIFE